MVHYFYAMLYNAKYQKVIVIGSNASGILFQNHLYSCIDVRHEWNNLL